MAAVAVANEGGLESGDSLQARLQAKQRRAEELKAKILQKRLQVQSLHVQLKAIGTSEIGFVPGQIAAGSGVGSTSGGHAELRSLLEWLAECVDLTRQVNFECGASGAGVVVGGRRVLLQRMAALPLGTGLAGSKLQLSIPLELQAEIVALLCSLRQRGGRASEVDLARVAERWELIGAEMVSASTGQQEPALFLVHREGQDGAAGAPREAGQPVRAIVVAQWPSIDFAKLAAATMFNADLHFHRLVVAAASAEQPPQPQEQPTPPPPPTQTLNQQQQQQQAQPKRQRQPEVPQLQQSVSGASQPQPQERQFNQAGAQQVLQSTIETCTAPHNLKKVHTGDRVVIRYRGQWFHGTLQHVDSDNNVANVKCDADSPGVITIVPLGSVWPAASPPEDSTIRSHDSTQRQLFRHARAKTVG